MMVRHQTPLTMQHNLTTQEHHMATSKGKRTAVPAAKKSAVPATKANQGNKGKDNKIIVEAVEASFCEIYALDDMATRYKKTPFSPITMRVAADALVSQVLENLMECVDVEHAHPALRELAQAKTALTSMVVLMLTLEDADDLLVQKETVGIAMRAFVVRAAQAMERAYLACGKTTGYSGYLDNPDLDPNRVEREAAQAEGGTA